MSLALATDLGVLGRRGVVTDRGDYLVVRTSDDPGFYHGNFLALAAPPRAGTIDGWVRRFTSELGGDPEIRHVTLRWDGVTEPAVRAELASAGFALDDTEAMTRARAGYLAPPSPAGVALRELAPEEHGQLAELAFAIGDRHDEIYRRFLHRRAAWSAELARAGEATFVGAFDGAALVGSLGLVPLGALARYQDIQTAATHRRRGIAGALLAAAARAVPCETLVLVVTPDSPAARVYTRAGFHAVERGTIAVRVSAPGARSRT